MQRRTFMVLGGAAVGWPLIAPAQQKPMPVIGVLGLTTPTIDVVAANLSALREGLREAGYTEGQNLRIEYPGPNAIRNDCRVWQPIWSGKKSMSSSLRAVTRRHRRQRTQPPRFQLCFTAAIQSSADGSLALPGPAAI